VTTTTTWPIEKPYVEKFSYTGLDLWGLCRGAWWFRYGPEKRKAAPSLPLILGSLAHQITADYDNHCMAANVPTDITAAPEMFRAFMEVHPEGAALRPELKRIFEGYVGSHAVDPMLKAVEKYLEVKDLSFRGRLDQLYYNPEATITHRVRDRKTDGQIRSQADVDSDFQLSTQALLVVRCYHVQEVEVEMDFLRYPGVIRKSRRTAEQIEETAEDIKARITQIRAAAESNKPEDFPFTPGAHCVWCEHIDGCPKIKELCKSEAAVVVASPEAALAFAGQMVALDARLDQIKDALKAWTSANGNLELNGLEIGHHLVESSEYPAEKAESVLRSFDLTPILYMHVDAKKIAELIKRDEKVAAALALIREDASHTQFRAKKIKAAKKPKKGD
jgi:5'(3')-deoxyribonucleotidase